jgi:hypothetical protein
MYLVYSPAIDRPCAVVTFNQRGADLNRDLTKNNQSTFRDDRRVARHLAIIVDGYVVSLPTIYSEIGAEAQLSGSEEDVDRLVEAWRSGKPMEFRILANAVDDRDGISDARFLINGDTPQGNAIIEAAQMDGTPPPGPRIDGFTGDYRVYDITLPNKHKTRVTYDWVQLMPSETRRLQLDSASKIDPKRNGSWLEAARSRGMAHTLSMPHQADEKLLSGALFYNRDCKNRNLSDQARQEQPVDYFVLTRNAEIDANGKPKPKIDETCIESVHKRSAVTLSEYLRNWALLHLAVLGAIGGLAGIVLAVRRWIALPREVLWGVAVSVLVCAAFVLIVWYLRTSASPQEAFHAFEEE